MRYEVLESTIHALLILALLSLGVLVQPATGLTRYLDKNNPSCSDAAGNTGSNIATPICTCNTAMTRMAGGDTLYIRAGTYTWPECSATLANGLGTWATATVMAAYPGEHVILDGGGGGGPNVQWQIWDGFDLPNGGFGCDTAGCHHLRIQNCLIYNTASYTGPFTMLIQGHPGTYTDPNSYPHHLEILNSVLANAGGGQAGHNCGDPFGCYTMYWGGKNGLFDGNLIYDNASYAFHIFQSSGNDTSENVVSNNVFYNNGFYDLRSPTNNYGGGAAMVIGSGPRNKVFNNLIFGNYSGIEVNYRCNDCEIYNNTVYGNETTGITVGNDTVGAIIRNNIVINNGGGDIQNCPPPGGCNPTTIIPANSNWLTTNGTPGWVNALTKSCFGPSCILFSNATSADFHLQGTSPVKNSRACINGFVNPQPGIPGLGTDFKNTRWANSPGLPRPQSPTPLPPLPCEPGAYEYQEGTAPPACPPGCPTGCPVACPTVCAATCPTDESPTGSDLYVDPDGAAHGTTPSDANGCRTAETLTTPKATLASACTCMTIPGKHLVLRGGNHGTIDTGTCAITGGASWAAPTKILRYASEVPVLQLPATNTPDAVMSFSAPTTDPFIEVDGLTLDGMSRSIGDGLLVLYSSNLRFKNLTILNNRYQNIALVGASNIEILTSTLTSPLGFANIALYDTSTNILISGNTLSSGVLAGVSLDPSATSNSVTVAKNTITNTVNGVDVGPGTGTVVQNNVIQNQSTHGIHFRNGALGWKAYHNTVVSNTGTGLLCDTGAGSGGTAGDWANNIAVVNTATQLTNTCGALNRGNLLTGTLAEIFTTVPVLKESVPMSPAINSGVDLPSVTDDQISNMRPFNVKWDAGAREAQLAPPPGPTTGVSKIMLNMFF